MLVRGMPVGIVQFREFELDLERAELRRHGVAAVIQRKPLELLSYLARNRERVVDKRELLAAVWADAVVSDHALNSALRDLRRVLGDEADAQRTVATLRGKGYRFVACAGETEARDEDPLVERAEVMAQLNGSLRAALAGTARISLLAGPPGIGKTRAASELGRAARALGVEVVVARCYGGEGTAALWPWLQVVRQAHASGWLDELSPRTRQRVEPLAWIAPELGGRGAHERRDLDRLEHRFRLFDAFAALLRARSRARPLLLIFDDLHWGDEASLRLLEYAAQNTGDARLHLVGTFRDTELGVEHPLSAVLGVIARQAGSERIDLSGLTWSAVEAWLGLAAGCKATRAFVDKVHAATAGNPFFVSEIARLVRSGQIDAASDAPADVPLPARVRDALRMQLARLSPPCRSLLELGSTAGRYCELSALASAAGHERAHTLALLDEALGAGLLQRVAERPGCYGFVHDLVREALYRDLSSAERARLHRDMARALEASPLAEDRLEQLAYHYGQAAEHDPATADKAIHYATLAAGKAMASMAYELAAGQYDRALELLALRGDAAQELGCRLLLDRAEAAWGTHEDAAAVQQRFERAAQSARAIGSAELLARAALGRTGHGPGPGDFRDIGKIDRVDIELLGEAERMLGDEPSRLRLLVMARLALAIMREQPERAVQLSARAVELAEALGDPETLAHVLRYRHEVLSSPGDVRDRLGLAERVRQLARQVGSRALELDALFFASRDCFELGDLRGAVEHGNAADALAATMRHPGAHFRSGTRRVLGLILHGKLDAAFSAAQRYYERDAARNLSAEGTLRAQHITIHWLRGEHEAVLRLLAREERTGSIWALSRYTRAYSDLALGRAEEARAAFALAAQDGFAGVPRDHTFLASALVLADLCLAFSDRAGAARLYEQLLPYAPMIAAPYIATVCSGAAARALGVLAHVLRRYTKAEQHFEQALALERRLESPPLVAHTLVRYARMLRARAARGDEAKAACLLAEATALAAATGCALPADAAREPREDATDRSRARARAQRVGARSLEEP